VLCEGGESHECLQHSLHNQGKNTQIASDFAGSVYATHLSKERAPRNNSTERQVSWTHPNLAGPQLGQS
jgi:hypothetical protein